MDHFDRVAPGLVLLVRYEDVLDDLEGQTRRICDFLGEDFEPEAPQLPPVDSPCSDRQQRASAQAAQSRRAWSPTSPMPSAGPSAMR